MAITTKSDVTKEMEVELADIGSVLSGFAFDSELFNDQGVGIPIVRIRDLARGYSETYYSGEYDNAYLVERGDLLISMDGEFKIFQWKSGSAILNQRICKLVINKPYAIPMYVFYAISKKLKEIEDKTPFVTVKHISTKQILPIKLSLPAPEVQKKIVSNLERLKQAKEFREQANELTTKFLKSVFLEMFGDPMRNQKKWEFEPFDYFAKIDTKMVNDFSNHKDKPHIGIENIERDTGDLIDYRNVGEQKLVSGKYLFTKKHIIYSKIRPNLNKVALPTFDGLCSADAYPILVNEKTCNRYFFAFMLRSELFLNHILKHSRRANIPKANRDQIRSFFCINPPVSLQNKFGDIVQSIHLIREQQQLSKQHLDRYWNNLMQMTFRSEATC